MEVYVDDLLVKSKELEHHLAKLWEAFTILQQYKMKLNLAKCAFSVDSGTFLAFMVLERGIDANSEKIKVVIDMKLPRNIKEVQRLTGGVAILN